MLAAPSRRTRARALTIVGAALVASSFTASTPVSATTSSEDKMARYINDTRANNGRRRLFLSNSISDIARAHSRAMAERKTIFHTTDLKYALRHYSWTVAGENVGRGPSLWRLHRAFMNSEAHRRNVLYRAYTRMGVGVVWRDGIAYVTVMFLNGP